MVIPARYFTVSSRPKWLRTLGRVLANPDLLLWVSALIFAPFYVFPSGLPQPGDMPNAFLILFLLALRRTKIPKEAWLTVGAIAAFVGWVVTINTYWMVLERNATQRNPVNPIFPLFYVYNAGVFLSGLCLYQKYKQEFLRYTFNGIAISAITLLVLAPFKMGGGTRTALFFNNPNQLGYFALCSATILVLIATRVRINSLYLSTSIFACLFMTLVSLSKSAMIGFGMLLFLTVLSPRVGARAVMPLLIATGLLIGIGMATPLGEKLITKPMKRLETLAKASGGDDGLNEERGYSRILLNPEYTILGAAEGSYYRFKGPFKNEIHSSYGTLVFAYGIPGTLAFLALLIFIHWPGGLPTLLIMLPNLVYGFHHQGLRSTLLWVMMAVVLITGVDLQRAKKSARSEGKLDPGNLPPPPKQSLL